MQKAYVKQLISIFLHIILFQFTPHARTRASEFWKVSAMDLDFEACVNLKLNAASALVAENFPENPLCGLFILLLVPWLRTCSNYLQ